MVVSLLYLEFAGDCKGGDFKKIGYCGYKKNINDILKEFMNKF
jgi:hypothetical protein